MSWWGIILGMGVGVGIGVGAGADAGVILKKVF